jgi:hypothetical protein
MLKKIMIGAGLATIIATSAMAQSFQPEVGSGNITPDKNQPYSGAMKSSNWRSGTDAYAFERTAPHKHIQHNHSMDRD